MAETEATNFRTRTGKARRAQTQRKIVEAALDLFDQDRVDRVTIEDVRAAAGLSRGSFYNYYPTFEAMLIAIAVRIAAQINIEQSAFFDQIEDLNTRICSNVRYFILRAVSDRACRNVLIRAVPLVGLPGPLMQEKPRRESAEAASRGDIDVPSVEIAVEFGAAIGATMVRRGAAKGIDDGEISAAGQMLLRSFGVPKDKAEAIANLPLPQLPPIALKTLVIEASVVAE